MNTIDVLQYGHQMVVEAVDGLPERDWHTGAMCGTWTVKDTIAHLASFEHLLIDVFRSLIAETATPTLNSFRAGSAVFNNAQVASRRHLPVTEVWSEYTATYRQTLSLITQIPIARRRLNRLIAWYGLEYDLEDFIVYNFYGHKREHSSQIAIFRERLASTE